MDPDWIAGLGGGLMIGTAAALYLLVGGRVMGASGILGTLVDGSARGADRAGKLAFVAGLILVPMALVAAGLGEAHAPVATTTGLVVAGLLVGVGTRLGNGCTSGHGVCGLSRLSVRGIANTVAYLIAGGVGLLVGRALGWSA